MKRWTLRILILLCLGAIVNVAVAWACAFRSEAHCPMFKITNTATTEDWMATLLDLFGAHGVATSSSASYEISNQEDRNANARTVSSLNSEVPTWARRYLTQVGTNREVSSWQEAKVRATGLPVLSLFGGIETVHPTPPTTLIVRSDWAIPRYERVGSKLTIATLFPLRPIWPGFAINTVFYAAMLFVLFFGFAQTRRAVRLRRGRCPKCAYDLRGRSLPSPTEREAGGEGDSGGGGCSECGWGRTP